LGVERESNNTSRLKSQLVTKCYTGPLAGSFEQGNEPSGSIKDGESLN